MTYALQGACDLAAHALAAPTAPIIAITALATLGLSGDPFTNRSTVAALASPHLPRR